MAGDIKNKYGTNNQAVTCSLASLGNGSAEQSTAIDNTTNLFDAIIFFLKVKSGASGTLSTGAVNVYIAGSADGGTTYAENAGATDAAITLTVPPNARFVGSMNVVANATTYYKDFYITDLPDHYVIIVENQTGHALDTTEGNHGKWYQGKYNQYT